MWTFKLPTQVHFGVGSASRMADLLMLPAVENMVVATDATMCGLPTVQALIATLDQPCVFSDIQPNPTIGNVNALAAVIRRIDARLVIAIGGGSVIDCAKAAACLAPTTHTSIRPFHSEGQCLGTEHVPVVAVPTTAGTGSEVTPFAVLDDPDKGLKGPMASPALYPYAAIVDPSLCLTLPRRVTAIGALDALSHAIEAYWSKNHQPICDVLALEAAKGIFAHLDRVYNAPGDLEGRQALSYAALLAGMAFQLPKNALIHACSFPLSSQYHMPHGAACAFTMEGAIRLNAPYMNGRMHAFARYCGFDELETMLAAITTLKRTGGLPLTLADAGIASGDIEALAAASFHPLINNNPKSVNKHDLVTLYMELA